MAFTIRFSEQQSLLLLYLQVVTLHLTFAMDSPPVKSLFILSIPEIFTFTPNFTFIKKLFEEGKPKACVELIINILRKRSDIEETSIL